VKHNPIIAEFFELRYRAGKLERFELVPLI